MGMLMKNNIVTNSTMVVTGETDKEYLLTNTPTRMKGTIEAMGETNEFDSDKETDRTSKMGKSFAETIGKATNLTVNKFSGATVQEKKESPEKPEANPMADVMKAFGSGEEDLVGQGPFMIIPAGKKTGDSWIIKDSTREKKSLSTYTIKSISNNIATIGFLSSFDVNNSIEFQGSLMDIMMNIKSTGEIIGDIKTGLVSKRITDSDISGTIDIMGQTMPITAKSKLVSDFTLSKD
jgi:hypothetical protein